MSKRSAKKNVLPTAADFLRMLSACSIPSWVKPKMTPQQAYEYLIAHPGKSGVSEDDLGWLGDRLNVEVFDVSSSVKKLRALFPNLALAEAEMFVADHNLGEPVPWSKIEKAVRLRAARDSQE